MSVGKRRFNAKSLAFATAIVTVFALVVPFVGAATAATNPPEPWTLALSPQQDSAAVGVCNPRSLTITSTNTGAPVVGQTVTVTITQDAPAGKTLNIAFCNPGSPTNPPQTGKTPNTTTTPTAGGTSNAATVPPNGSTANSCTLNNSAGTTAKTLTCVGTFNAATDANGNLYFGVASDTPGTMTIQAQATATTQQGGTGQTYFSNSTTKTWVTGVATQAKTISCTWDANGQPGGPQFSGSGTTSATGVDSTHSETFSCVVKDAAGNVLNGAPVNYQITSGPDATANGNTASTIYNCNGTTPVNNTAPNNQTAGGGLIQCTLNHTAGTNTTGTDNIIVFVEQGCPPPTGQSVCGPGVQTYEPQQGLTKTFSGAPRNVACTPATATNPSGTSHTITCTVTDVKGQPVPGAIVFAASSGPGHFTFPAQSGACGFFTSTTDCGLTDNNGTISFTVATSNSESGTENIAFSISSPPSSSHTGQECAKVAGNPTGSTAGNCETSATKIWQAATTPPPPSTPTTTNVATNLTIRYDRNAHAFKGSVGSSELGCQVGRLVHLFKKFHGEKGQDVSNSHGNWRVNKRHARGKWFATVDAKSFQDSAGNTFNCLFDQSPTIKVGRH